MVQTMLVVDCILACTQFSDGMFPDHVSTKVAHACGYMGLKKYSIQKLGACQNRVNF